MKRFNVAASWDTQTKLWCGGNDELSFTTEAPTFPEFEERAAEIGQARAEISTLVAVGELVEIQVVIGGAGSSLTA